VQNYDRYQHYSESKYNRKGISWLLMKKQADKKLIPYVKNIEKEKILEVGPGYGYYTRLLLENGNSVSGVDINPDLGSNIGIEIIKGRADQLQDVVYDKYDRVLSFFMTEYLDYRELSEFMLQGINLLRPNGVFATTVIMNKGVGALYINLARMKGIKKYNYSVKELQGLLGEKYCVNLIPLPSILNIQFAVLLEVKNMRCCRKEK